MSRGLSARSEPTEGTIIGGRYRVMTCVGRGGMGGVYRAVDVSHGREVALKIMAAEQGKSAEGPLRFRREFHTLARFHHPRIVEAYEFGVAAQTLYYTMELLDGRDLRDLGRVPFRQACTVLRDLASALAFLHARRLVHRDVASRNVRCTNDGRAKLIDFGLLAAAGATTAAAGTPPFVAPETLRGQPVDHRVDLFGLGALLYWMLTGHHAFPAKTLEALPEMWGSRPPPPSALAPEISPALDELVLSLISTNPLGRPHTAAEVIDRLGAIAQLDPAPELAAARSYLASTTLVGREREMRRARRWLDQAASGHGRAVVISGPTGIGKTRLLKELSLEAQMRGGLVVSVTGDAAERGPYGTLREALRIVLARAPDMARTANAAVATLLPELAATQPVPRTTGDPNQERLRVQAELTEWLLAAAKDRLLVLLLDDVQRCDEASAAVIASLAHDAKRHRLIVMAAFRTDEPARAATPVAALCDAASMVELQGLTVDDLEQLVLASFGPVANARRLALWMYRASGGTPLYCTELLRDLVERGTIAYLDGVWMIPDSFDHVEAPPGFAEAMERRLQALSPLTRALGETLSVHGGEMELGFCVQVSGTAEDAVFGALDELVHGGLLIGAEGRHRFVHDGVREAFLRRLPEPRRRELHLQIGRALAASGRDGAEDTLAIGWHLLRGGDAARGADYLARGGTALFEAQSMVDAIPPLEAALDVIEAGGGSPRRCAELRMMLIFAGSSGDHTVLEHHAHVMVRELRVSSGLETARWLGRWLGPRTSLVLGVGCAAVRWLITPRRRRGANPVRALQWLFLCAASLAMLYGQAFDLPRYHDMLDMIRPAAVFRNRLPYAVYLLLECMLDFMRAHHGTIEERVARAIHIVQHDRLAPISDFDRQSGECGARMMPVFVAVSRQEPRHAELIAAVEKHGLWFYAMQGCQARVAYFRSRGEEHDAVTWEAKAEVLAVRLGSLRYVRAWLAVVSSLAYGLTRDVMGLKRSIHELWRLTEDGFAYEAPLLLARGEYYRERGELEQSRRALERCLEVVPADVNLIAQPALAALAETYLAEGELDRAAALASRAVAHSSAPETAMIANEVRSQRVMAFVEAARGDLAAAAGRLDAIIARTAAIASPSLCGTLHDARARIAFASGDLATFVAHAHDAGKLFAASRNPVLIARGERLREIGAATDGRAALRATLDDAVTASAPSVTRSTCSTALGRCRGPGERASRALELLLEATSATMGYLFVRRGDRLEVAAPAAAEVSHEIATAAAQVVDGAATHDEASVFCELTENTPATVPARPRTSQIVPLRVVDRGRVTVVGSAVLIGGAVDMQDADRDLVDEIARAIEDRHSAAARAVEG